MPICKFLPPHAESHHRLEEINSNTTYTLFPASCMTLHKVVIFISNKLPHACANMPMSETAGIVERIWAGPGQK